MKIFTRAASTPASVTPKTFEDAAAPLKKIAMDLIWLEGNCIESAMNSEKEIIAAQLYADTVRETHTEITKTFREEAAKASKAAKAIIALLGEETA